MKRSGHPPHHLLLLAGSGEARAIAGALARDTALHVTASLFQAPRGADALPLATRLGGFGGDEGFRAYLKRRQVTAVLDATHPFANRVSARSSAICADLGLAYAQVLRPPWQPGPGDNWTEVADESAAAARVLPGQRAFTTTGRATLSRFRHFAGAHLFVRRMTVSDAEPEPVVPNLSYVTGRGPFSVADEIATLTRLRIDVLIAKNSGGIESRTKLDAARALGLPVILIARPPQPPGQALRDVRQALDWVAAL